MTTRHVSFLHHTIMAEDVDRLVIDPHPSMDTELGLVFQPGPLLEHPALLQNTTHIDVAQEAISSELVEADIAPVG